MKHLILALAVSIASVWFSGCGGVMPDIPDPGNGNPFPGLNMMHH